MSEPTTGARERGATHLNLGPMLLAGTAIGAVIIAGSQFMILFHTRIASSRTPVASVTVGSAHGYALLPIALLALLLGYGVWRVGSRPALLAIGALGLISLLISLVRDLPDASKSGVRIAAGHYVQAANSPAIGIYAETLGAVILLITCVSGFILAGGPAAAAGLTPAPRARRARVARES